MNTINALNDLLTPSCCELRPLDHLWAIRPLHQMYFYQLLELMYVTYLNR